MVRAKKSDAWTPLEGLALSSLHHRTIAIQLVVAGQERLLVGYGAYEHDQSLGYVSCGFSSLPMWIARSCLWKRRGLAKSCRALKQAATI
jgi:hypothetical protein